MTSDAGREQEEHRLAAAYRYAASSHRQAAEIYENVAQLYDEGGKPDPMRVAEDDSRPGPHGADLAALLGATIAVLLTLTGSPGAWGPLATIIGLLLLVVLLAFFWQRRPKAFPWRPSPPAKKRKVSNKPRWQLFFDRDFFVGFGLSIVVAFVAAIAIAQTIQWRAFGDSYSRFECRSVAVAQATAAVRDLGDIPGNGKALQRLVLVTLNRQSGDAWSALTSGDDPVIWGGTPAHTSALGFAFVHQYKASVDDCLAGETFESLWWVGPPCFLLALGWWYWDAMKEARKKR